MKRSSKKYRNIEKRNRKKTAKKAIAAGMMICLGSLPIWCDDEVLLTLFPTAGKSVASYADVQSDFGVGGKLTWRKNGNLDFFVEADYKNLNLPNVSSATMINGGVGAGYHLPINDRWGVNLSAQVGGYRASKEDGLLTGLSGGLNISMTYRINSKISVEAGASANHYVAKPEALLTDVGGTAGLTVNLTRAFSDATNVKMETKEILPVFPVLYSWYKNNSFASVGITNEEDADIENVRVSFFQPQYMSQPNLCATAEKLGKGETFDAELTAFFNERMLDLTEKTNTEASVIIEYSYLGEKKKKTISMVVPVYGRNSMSWDDDRRASVFVSSKDPAALWFSKYISSVVRDNIRMGVPTNIQYAMGIFETLDQFGINYVIDPASAYSDNVGSASIDFLQFPYQTLAYRGGDCDDLSILTCSLFEAVGIKTAFITIPGHIFMAFDSGLTMSEASQSLMNTSNLINHNGEAWVPLEITLTDEGFSRAWRTGARQWNQAHKDGTAAFYTMEDSWKIYDPVSVPGATANFTLPEKEVVSRLFQHSMDQWVAREISPVVAEYNARLAVRDSVELRNELGILYGRYGLFVEADDQFKRARRKGYLPSLLNTANVYFARKQYTIALEWYKKVLEEDAGNELAILGLARCYYELEDYDQCDAAFDIVRNKNPALASEYTYLGAFEQTVGRSYSLADRIALTKWDTGNTSSGITNLGSSSNYEDESENEDSNGFVIAETDGADSISGGNADELLAQLSDMNGPNGMLMPDTVVREEKRASELPPDPYAAMDDYNNLVEELPGLLAQLRIPEASLDPVKTANARENQLLALNQSTTNPEKEAAPKKDLSSLITKATLEQRETQPTVEQTPITVTPTVAVTTPTVEQTPVTVATTAPVTQPTVEETPVTVTPTVAVTTPTVEQTPVTVTPTVAVTTPTVEQSPVTVATTAPVTQPTVEETPVTVAPTVAVTTPTVEQTPVTVTPTVAVNTPTVEQTPVTVTPTVAVTTPTVEQTPVTVATTAPVTQPTVEETPVTVAPTVAVTTPTVEQTTVTVTPTAPVTTPTVEQTPVTVTPTVAVTTPTVEQTPVTVATTAPVTQPTVEQSPVTVTPTVAVTTPTVEQTPVTVTPTVAVTTPTVEQTPITVTPTVAVTTPTVEQTPVTVTPTVAVTTPTVEQTPVTVATTAPVTQPTVEETPVNVTPTVAVTTPTVEETPVTVTPTVAVTTPTVEQTPVTVTPTVAVTTPTVEDTPVTVTPTVDVTTPTVEQTPITVTPTVDVTTPTVEQTPITVTPTVAVTPTVEQTSVTVTPTVAVTTPTVEQTPVTVTPTVAVTTPNVEETPVTVTPTVAVTTPTVEQTPVTVTSTVAVTTPNVEETPVTVTPTVAVTTPNVEETPVTVTPTVTVTTPTVEQTPITVTPTVAVTTPTVEETPSTTPKFTTEPVVIRDTQTVLDELGLEEEDVFAALMNEDDDDMFADTPIASLMAQDKTKENERSALDSFGPQLKPTEEETIQQEEEIALASVVPTVEREVPRYSDSPSSKWVPEEVYSAKIIPGMKTYEEEMSTYSQDKSWLYEDTTSGLLSDDTDEAIAMEKAKEMLEQEEKENARLAQENWDKLINDDVNDPSNPLFTYLSKENLEEIQTVSIVDKIREQELLSPAEKLANEKKSGLLAKTNEILKRESAAKKKPAEEPVEEKPEEKELIAQVTPAAEEKTVDNVEKTDSNIKEKVEEKKSNVWPYVAGGSGLLGLFVIFLIVFWKRDDDDDDDKKNSLEKQGVNV